MEFLKNEKRADNPYRHCNIFSKLMFSYVSNVMSIGNKRVLSKIDILKNREQDESQMLTRKLEKCWLKQLDKQEKQRKPSFFRAMVSFARKKFFINLQLFFVMEAIKLVQPVFLKMLLDVVAEEDFANNNNAYIWASAFVLCVFGQWALSHPLFYCQDVLGTNCRSAALGVVYKKVFQLSKSRLGAISVGHVITLFSSDAHKLQEGLRMAPYIAMGPVQVIIVVYLLWREVGPSCLAGIGILILFLPLQSWLGKLYAYLRIKTVKKTDQRVGVMNEVISSMQVAKMYTWEDSFGSLVKKIRKEESNCILKAALMRGINTSMYGSSPYIVLFATFVTYYFHGDGITMAKVYFAMSLFFVVRLSVVLFFPLAIQMLTEFYVGCKRIEKYLLQEEMAKNNFSHDNKDGKDPFVIFDHVSTSWSAESTVPVLKNITFKADKGNKLVIINGPVGSGKTSILMAAMNEIAIIEGNVKVRGTVSYVSQEAWIFSGTIRQNILFGKDYDEGKFENVIDICALRKDIELFEKGDLTLVGERGVSLSGGQKSRLSLARAVYADSDIYYLDDPLSAVDPKVGRQLFDQCIKTQLKSKIVLLVTHQVQYLEEASQVITLNELKATYSEADLSKSKSEDSGCYNEKEDKQGDPSRISDANQDDEDGVNPGDFTSEVKSRSCDGAISDRQKKLGDEDDQEEHRAQGQIGYKTYVKYFGKGVGWFQSTFLFFVMVLGQVHLTFIDYWVGEWSQSEDHRTRNKTIESKFIFKRNPDYNIYFFTGLLVIGVVLNTFRGIYFFQVLVKCSRSLHDRMFNAVLKAPIYFFDTNPVGQILNRFSRDIYLMDDELPWIFSDFVRLSLLTMAVVVISCLNVPYLVILVVILGGIFIFFRRYYLNASRELRRLEAVARSPLYTHISATLAGISTIRSFGLTEHINKEFHKCLNYQTEAWIMFITASRWFSQRLDLMVAVYVACAAYAPIIIAPYVSNQDRGLIGVSFAYILILCGMFQWTVRQSAEVDNLMTSVERVIEYSHLIGEPDVNKSTDLPEKWPSDGRITAHDAYYAYHETLPYVLKNVCFEIRPTEKIGIIGRTGAGKSSIISMLFRLGKTEGIIKIDDVDITHLKLKELRSAMSVIPQDPVLFSGTLRKNLDPFQEYTDEAIWNALKEVQLKKTVQEFKSKLETEISESGSNLSVGEKQLLCLARALLKNNKILMIDEATANVDHGTDKLIQKTIREKFRDCTVLTIAHRLNTVIDSDRILVMDEGKIAEFDAPYILLQSNNGLLRKLVNQNGTSQASKLEQLAHENYFAKTNDTKPHVRID